MRKLEQERASKGLCICCGAPALPKKGGGYMRVCQYHRDKNREYDKKRRKRKAEQADSATKPYTRMLERAYTGNVAARYMHRCPNCNIVVHNEFYHCPWCGARQPEVWETEE